jgi:hypothetical protein
VLGHSPLSGGDQVSLTPSPHTETLEVIELRFSKTVKVWKSSIDVLLHRLNRNTDSRHRAGK